jgi:methyl-accepting chemotaxis protein
VSLFSILVDIAARTADFDTGMARVEKRLDSFSTGAKRVAKQAAGVLGLAIGFDKLRTAVEGAIQRGDELGRLSDALQVSVKDLSQLQYAARANDVDFKTLTGSISTFQKGLGQAANGTGRAQQAIKDLGLDAKALAALPLGQQLDTVADALKNVSNPTQRARISLQLFGDAGLDLLPILSQGSEGIRKLREESDRLGFTLDESGAKKLSEADAAVKLLTSSFQGLVSTLAIKAAPAIAATADSFRKLLGGATEIEKLQSKLDILKAEKNSSIPLFLNLGYVDGASVVMGPTALKKAIDEIESRIASLKKAASDPKGGGSNGAEAKPDNPIVRDWINPQLMLELENNFDFLEELARKTAERMREAAQETKHFWEEVNHSISEGVGDTAHDVEESLRQFSERYAEVIGMGKEANDQLSEYAKQAARNMQDAFADFLFDPFQDGIKGMLKGFVDVIRRMLAEAAAAQIFEKLFGKDGKSGAGGNILGAILGAFGGGKAKGGPLESGKWYVAGEHGPEPIWGGGSGAFAAGYGGGGGSVVVNMPIDMRGASVDAVSLLMAEKPRLIRQAADLAKAELRQDKRRGRF